MRMRLRIRITTRMRWIRSILLSLLALFLSNADVLFFVAAEDNHDNSSPSASSSSSSSSSSSAEDPPRRPPRRLLDDWLFWVGLALVLGCYLAWHKMREVVRHKEHERLRTYYQELQEKFESSLEQAKLWAMGEVTRRHYSSSDLSILSSESSIILPPSPPPAPPTGGSNEVDDASSVSPLIRSGIYNANLMVRDEGYVKVRYQLDFMKQLDGTYTISGFSTPLDQEKNKDSAATILDGLVGRTGGRTWWLEQSMVNPGYGPDWPIRVLVTGKFDPHGSFVRGEFHGVCLADQWGLLELSQPHPYWTTAVLLDDFKYPPRILHRRGTIFSCEYDETKQGYVPLDEYAV